MHKLAVFVPGSHKEAVKQALFAAGAGKMGDYEHCCWETKGTGQFRPLATANPFLGEPGQVESVTEFKLEMVVADDLVHAAIVALRQSHPYEEPAFDLWPLVVGV